MNRKKKVINTVVSLCYNFTFFLCGVNLGYFLLELSKRRYLSGVIFLLLGGTLFCLSKIGFKQFMKRRRENNDQNNNKGDHRGTV